eukprot:GFYU01002397.1.p1 GENE.GFYU01002397.1~~GFYU01002397.1.p1  ORF type:complete len:206 (-),score=35.64 GFYU01002397.1:169-786(-)
MFKNLTRERSSYRAVALKKKRKKFDEIPKEKNAITRLRYLSIGLLTWIGITFFSLMASPIVNYGRFVDWYSNFVADNIEANPDNMWLKASTVNWLVVGWGVVSILAGAGAWIIWGKGGLIGEAYTLVPWLLMNTCIALWSDLYLGYFSLFQGTLSLAGAIALTILTCATFRLKSVIAMLLVSPMIAAEAIMYVMMIQLHALGAGN